MKPTMRRVPLEELKRLSDNLSGGAVDEPKLYLARRATRLSELHDDEQKPQVRLLLKQQLDFALSGTMEAEIEKRRKMGRNDVPPWEIERWHVLYNVIPTDDELRSCILEHTPEEERDEVSEEISGMDRPGLLQWPDNRRLRDKTPDAAAIFDTPAADETSLLREELEATRKRAEAAESALASLANVRDALQNGAKDNGGPEAMEYGAPAEIVTEVEPEQPEVSRALLALMVPGETIKDAFYRLYDPVAREYDKMTQLLLSGAGRRVIDDDLVLSGASPSALGKTVNERHGELSALKNELERLGSKVLDA